MLTKAERTKQLILETAMPLYNERGISGVSIDDILAATKLTKGCIYGHFENKDDLSEQVIAYSLKKMSDKMSAIVSKEKTAKGKIFAYLDFYKNPLKTFISGGCPIINAAVEVDDNYPDIKKKVAQVVCKGQIAISDILRQGIANSEFSEKLDVEVFSFKLMSAVEGGLVMCRIMGTSKPMLGLISNLKNELEQYTS